MRLHFRASWLSQVFSIFIFAQVLDIFTTWVGLRIGLVEIGRIANPIVTRYGFAGLLALKIGAVVILGCTIAGVFLWVYNRYPQRLRRVSKMLTVGCIMAIVITLFSVVSNLHHLDIALIDGQNRWEWL